MTRRFLLALALLAPCLAYGADPSGSVSVEVVPAGPTPLPPVQAQAQEFTTLAFDGDMTKGFDVSCDNPATGPHQWYLGANRTMAANCANLRYPHTDETDGSRVLDIHWGPSTKDGGVLARVGIGTADWYGEHQTSFPVNAYYECTVRFDAYSLSHMPMWNACWFVHASTDVISGRLGGLGIEFDLTEFHGGYPNNQELAGAINWNCRDTCYSMAWFGNAKDKIPGYDASTFHKYGWLLYQTSPTNLHSRSYIDDVLINEGDIQLYDTDVTETGQRNWILIHLNAGCNWDEGGTYCTNQPIQKVYGDSNGNTRVMLPWIQVWSNSFLMGITKVQGVTSPINGNWWVDCTGQCQDFGIYDPVTRQPVPFAGQHVPNTGVLNDWNDTDHEMHVYVKSYRVWSCAKWAATQCSTYNPN